MYKKLYYKAFYRSHPLQNSPSINFLKLVASDKLTPYETSFLIHYYLYFCYVTVNKRYDKKQKFYFVYTTIWLQ